MPYHYGSSVGKWTNWKAVEVLTRSLPPGPNVLDIENGWTPKETYLVQKLVNTIKSIRSDIKLGIYGLIPVDWYGASALTHNIGHATRWLRDVKDWKTALQSFDFLAPSYYIRDGACKPVHVDNFIRGATAVLRELDLPICATLSPWLHGNGDFQMMSTEHYATALWTSYEVCDASTTWTGMLNPNTHYSSQKWLDVFYSFARWANRRSS